MNTIRLGSLGGNVYIGLTEEYPEGHQGTGSDV